MLVLGQSKDSRLKLKESLEEVYRVSKTAT